MISTIHFVRVIPRFEDFGALLVDVTRENTESLDPASRGRIRHRVSRVTLVPAAINTPKRLLMQRIETVITFLEPQS